MRGAATAAIALTDFGGGVVESITFGQVKGAFGSNPNSTAYLIGSVAGALAMAVAEFLVFSK